MKISGRGIEPFLVNPPAELCAVLIYGHDRGLMQERAEIIARKFIPDLNDPFAVTTLSADDVAKDSSILIDSAAAIPAMGGHRIVRMDQTGANCLNALKYLLEKAPKQSLTVVMASDDINTKSAMVKLFEKAEHAASIGCYTDSDQSLAQIAQAEFRAHNISIDRDVMAWITQHLGNDRMASRSEIDKLIIMAGEGGGLTLDQVQHALGDGAGINVNEAIYAAADGRVKQLSTALARVQLESIPGERLLRTAQSYFLKLYRITAAMDDGVSRDQAMGSIKPPIFFSEKPIVEGHLRLWSSARCRRAIERLIDAEKQSRRGIPADTAAAQAMIALALSVRR
jgi:DNA polymerase-3 subunit delta